jgi:hypothetical protein
MNRDIPLHFGMAGEEPAGCLPFGRKVGTRRYGQMSKIVRRHPDGALAAVTGAVAGGLDKHPGLRAAARMVVPGSTTALT